jgi:hypothetical protein
MLYLNNPLLSANGIISELEKITTDSTERLKTFKKKLASIYFPEMNIEQIKTEIESERFTEFPQLQVVLREIFFKEQHPGAINIAGLADWTPPASYTDKTFQVLNARYGYFLEQGEPIFNTLKPLCRKMTQLVERQADDNEMAYKLMVLFSHPQDFSDPGECLTKISKSFINISQQVQYGTPYHDAFVTELNHFPTVADAKNIQEWRQFILNFNFPALPFFADCRSFESVPKTLKEAQAAQLAKIYPRAKENTEFAQFCKAYRAKNDEFEKGLDFIKTGWPKKTRDNLPLVDIKLIDRGTNTEYRWVKLPPEDLRALYLGIMIPGCCQVINGHSSQCVIDGTSLSDNGFYVLLKKKVKESEEESKEQEAGDLLDGDIVAQSYAWISQNGNLCLDSIEWDKARVTEAIIKILMDKFALEVFQQNPQIKYVNVGSGGQTPPIFGNLIDFPEQQRQGEAYRDSKYQYCIQSRLETEQIKVFQKQISGLDKAIKAKLLYLASYLDSTEFSYDMIKRMSKLLASSFIQPFPAVHQPLMTTDFNTLTFESYQKLSSDEKIKISTFCKLINCNSLESFVEWLSVIPNSERFEAVKQKNQSGRTIMTPEI